MDLFPLELHRPAGAVGGLHLQGEPGALLPLDGLHRLLPGLRLDGLAVHGADDLPHLQAGLLGGAARCDSHDLQPVRRLLAHGDADAHIGVAPGLPGPLGLLRSR